MVFKAIVSVVLWLALTVGVYSAESNVSADAPEILKKLISQQCVKKYSMSCFKMDVIRMVIKLGQSPSYELLPGIALAHLNHSEKEDFPFEVMASLAEGNSTSFDGYFNNKVNDYLNSLTLNVKVLDSGTILNARKWGERMLVSYTGDQTGRKKGGGAGAAAMMAAGSIAAMGMAGLAALSGKALMTAMLALMLAAAGAFKGHGGGGEKCTHYIDATHHKGRRMIEANDRIAEDPILHEIYITERKPGFFNRKK